MAFDTNNGNRQPPGKDINLSHLSISSHVVVQLGEELVTNVEQALLELAKNAYDADSETCKIIIDPDWCIKADDPSYDMLFVDRQNEVRQDEVVGRLQVIDEGDGLSEDAVKDGWLRISASLKRPIEGAPKAKTPKGRTLVGDKGLGRLATMKIGTVLRLRTALEGEKVWRTVTFSWNSFTPDRTLEMVPVDEGTEARNEPFNKGTVIEIVGLRERARWSDVLRTERELIPRLSSLVSPFQEDVGFTISVQQGAQFFELTPLDSAVLNLASAHFIFDWDGSVLTQKSRIAQSLFRGKEGEESRIDFEKVFPNNADAFFEFLANPKRLGKRGLRASASNGWFVELEDIDEFKELPEHRRLPGAKNPGPFKAELHYFLLGRENVRKLKSAGINSSEQLKAMSGIGIFREGFRISADKDWLGISEGQTSGTSYYGLRPSNVIGYFTISNEHNPRLTEKSDREAFVDNPEFRGFQLLSLKCRDYANGVLEVLRRSYRNYAKEVLVGGNVSPTPRSLIERVTSVSDAQPQTLKQLEAKLGSAFDNALTTKSSDPKIADGSASNLRDIANGLLKQTVETVQAQAEQIRANSSALAIHWEDSKEQNLRLIDAAAVGLSARTLTHELHQYVRQYREGIAQIAERNKKYHDDETRSAVRLLSSTTRELARTVAGIDPLLPGSRAIKETFSLHPAVVTFLEERRAKANGFGFDILFNDSSSVQDFSIRFSRSRFLQILENLFQNSLYWIRRGPPGLGGPAGIFVEVTPDGFTWSDSGPGVKPSLEGTIFDAFVSDKPNDEGQGLGLHIITTYLELERCAIRLTDDRNELGRCYKFALNFSSANPTIASSPLF